MTSKDQSGRLLAGRRIVIKIGSALLVDPERGTVHRKWLEALAADLADCRARGQEVVVVSSGAIAVGRRHLSLPDGELKLGQKQAAAATGMVRLTHAYQETMARYNINVAQVLLTLDDSENRRRYINARNTLDTLLSLDAMPLINENDTVATDEIRFGDNDRLAARVAAMISADVLVLLSDVDGFHTADPGKNPQAKVIPVINGVTPEIEAMAGAAQSNVGTGGMVTKLAAAKVALAAGCSMAITDGRPLHPLRRMGEGGVCSWFVSSATPRTARKRWIAGTLKPAGVITVDGGAVNALRRGKSLLPAGVAALEGSFQRGDAVIVRSSEGEELGRGLVAYSVRDAKLIIGHKSGEIENLLGYRGRDEMIHRDDFVLS